MPPSILISSNLNSSIGYTDNCHPNNPNCVSGATCPNCNDGFNPHLIVACNLIVFSDGPTEGVLVNAEIQTERFKIYNNVR